MTTDLIARLRGYKGNSPCAEAADALEALGREVAELKLRAGNGYSRKIEELIAERDQAVSAAIQVALDRKGDRDQPTRQALLDALEAQWKEVERMGRQILSDTDAFIHVRDQRDTLRAELAAIRAQEPVAWMYLHAGHKELTFTDQRPVEAAHPNFAKSTPLYASPVANDAGLVADGCLWTQDSHFEVGDTYDSACGEKWAFIDGGPEENNVRFCQGCGKPVKLAAPPKIGGV